MAQTRTIYISADGLAITGLSPTWDSLKKVSDGSDISSTPSISEVGGGFYKFDADIPLNENWCGVVDAGASLDDVYRYIPVVMGSNDISYNEAVYVTPQYDEDSDTLQFVTFMLVEGQIHTSVTDAEISVYDTTHTLQFTVSSSSPTAGVFMLAKNEPDLNNLEAYYLKAKITDRKSVV